MKIDDISIKARLSVFSIEDLKACKYPNLVAEVKETTYSICTIAAHMGLSGGYRKENDSEVWDKLTGTQDIFASEIVGLMSLFNVSLDYLFSSELEMQCGKPAAYWRWLEAREKMEAERSRRRFIDEIERAKNQTIFIGIYEGFSHFK